MHVFVRCPGLTGDACIKKCRKTDEKTAPKIAMVDRRDTALQSSKDFFLSVAQLRGGDTGLTAATMGGVGMRCDGRSSAFDLWWFTNDSDKVYAVDAKDDAYVCSVRLA